jgi:anthranilate synthase component 1
MLKDLSGDPYFSMWESSPRRQRSYLFANITTGQTISLSGDSIIFDQGAQTEKIVTLEAGSNPLTLLADLTDFNNSTPEITSKDYPPFLGGLMGYVSYDIAQRFEKLTNFKSQQTAPDYFFIVPRCLLISDKSQNRIWISIPKSVSESEANKIATALYTSLIDAEKTPTPCTLRIEHSDLPSLPWDLDQSSFERIVSKAKSYITEGDIFQVVLSNRLRLGKSISPHALYSLLRIHNQSAFHFLIQYPGAALVGASPEVMLRSGEVLNRIFMRLVAGTYPKGTGTLSYRKPAEEILEDEKEKAEHIMLVDHCRNDIGRVSKISSVEVSDLFSIEELSDVYHLISQVDGILREEVSVFDAIQACNPIATLTGTPKIRAMDIISELEPFPRGLFGGLVGVIGFDGYIDTAVIIRSAIIDEASAIVYAGAGIVDDSIPSREYEECMWKAKTLVELILSMDEK